MKDTKLEHLLLILLIIVLSPYLFISGGLVRIKRFRLYVIAKANGKYSEQYYF